jgi:Asparagine synthase (glutamine-hydrolyzing)
MPGIFGYINADDDISHPAILKTMCDLMQHRRSFKVDSWFHDRFVHAGRCYPAFETNLSQPKIKNGVSCWFDGEFYTASDVNKTLNIFPYAHHIVSDADVLLEAYYTGQIAAFLRAIDGYFSAVIYDEPKKKLILISDRFGMRHLYWYSSGNFFSWASECKAFLALPSFKSRIDPLALKDFLRVGMLCDNRSWLKDVSVLPPATILTVDCNTIQSTIRHYWNPQEINPIQGNFDVREYCTEWGRLFCAAVLRRCSKNQKTGITLSGGLDSRALLAAMPQFECPIHAFTLGNARCDDVRFAARAARLKGAFHHVLELRHEQWLPSGFRGIWASDGSVCLSSQLGIEFLKTMGGYFTVCLNGIGGGRMQGGKVIGSGRHDESDRVDENGEPGLQMIRRRMLRQGFRLDESYFNVRMPFFDNTLYSFIMSAPASIRAKGILYIKALMRNFPEFYKSIPWQQAGVPISLPTPFFEIGTFIKRSASKLARIAQQKGFPVQDQKLYFNPGTWLRMAPSRSIIGELLGTSNALYTEYIDKKTVEKAWRAHLSGNDKTEDICRYATLEIWLQQIFLKNLRPEIDD